MCLCFVVVHSIFCTSFVVLECVPIAKQSVVCVDAKLLFYDNQSIPSCALYSLSHYANDVPQRVAPVADHSARRSMFTGLDHQPHQHSNR